MDEVLLVIRELALDLVIDIIEVQRLDRIWVFGNLNCHIIFVLKFYFNMD